MPGEAPRQLIAAGAGEAQSLAARFPNHLIIVAPAKFVFWTAKSPANR